MRLILRTIWLVAAVHIAGGALAATPGDRKDCEQGADRERRIAGCTRVIEDSNASAVDRAISYGNRGIAYEGKGDYDRAIADYNDAIRLDPKHVNAYITRAIAYVAKGEFDRAIADFTEVIRLDPKSAKGYSSRASMWNAKGDYDRALPDYNEAIRLEPSGTHYTHRCWGRARAGRDLPQALSDCDQALRLAPNGASIIGTRAFVYLRLNRLDDAIASFDAALKRNSKSAFWFYGRGLAKLRKGDAAGGNADISAAKAIQSDIAEEFARYGVKTP